MSEIIITEKTLAKPAATPASLELPAIAWRGLFKDYLDMVAPTTEATDAFHYAAFLQVFGCTLGRRLHVYHAGRQFPNFYTCLIGRSGASRKDTSFKPGRDMLERLHAFSCLEGNPPFKITWGIRSYEGLLDELSGERKVRLIQLTELLSLFAKAGQQKLGNIIPELTGLYDCPDLINPPVHQKDVAPAQEPFLSIMALTTQDWLQRALTEQDIYGGFANRWCYFTGRPKSPIADPPKADTGKRDEIVRQLNQVRGWADSVPDGEITKSDEARALFKEYYNNNFYPRCQQPGLLPTLIERVQNFVWKIALLYAAETMSEVISRDHLEAAIAVGNYLEASVAQVFASFGESKGKQVETRVYDYLRCSGVPVPYRDIYHSLRLSGKELEMAVEPLIKVGLIKNHYEGKKRLLEVY